MEDVIYIGMKNDLSFIIMNEMNLYEHQSTLNENMPLRGFLYFARLYESYIETHKLNRHQKKMIGLPFPRFIVFYNGEAQIPEVFKMKLSDSFEKKEEEPAIECIATIININYGYNEELLKSCKRLHDYSYFVANVRDNIKKGMRQKEAVVCAIDHCIEEGILEDVLLKHRAEVEDMFLTTFDKKMYEEALRIDAREEGLVEGRKMGLEIGCAEEIVNTERERQRAERAEKENEQLRKEIEKLKAQMPVSYIEKGAVKKIMLIFYYKCQV